jgi:hypothetical protein
MFVQKELYDNHSKVRMSWLQLPGRDRQEALQHCMC